MKALLLALTLCVASLRAAAAETDSPKPADYPLVAHILVSRSAPFAPTDIQKIFAIIDGHQVELTARASGVLPLGDYPARIVKKGQMTPPDPNGLIVYYEILFPNGHTRLYRLAGFGFFSQTSPPN